MRKVPVVSGRDLARRLEKIGFIIVRQKGTYARAGSDLDIAVLVRAYSGNPYESRMPFSVLLLWFPLNGEGTAANRNRSREISAVFS